MAPLTLVWAADLAVGQSQGGPSGQAKDRKSWGYLFVKEAGPIASLAANGVKGY